jgi:hypothetical protein
MRKTTCCKHTYSRLSPVHRTSTASRPRFTSFKSDLGPGSRSGWRMVISSEARASRGLLGIMPSSAGLGNGRSPGGRESRAGMLGRIQLGRVRCSSPALAASGSLPSMPGLQLAARALSVFLLKEKVARRGTRRRSSPGGQVRRSEGMLNVSELDGMIADALCHRPEMRRIRVSVTIGANGMPPLSVSVNAGVFCTVCSCRINK